MTHDLARYDKLKVTGELDVCVVAESPGRSWDVPSRPRVDKHPLQERLRWELTA